MFNLCASVAVLIFIIACYFWLKAKIEKEVAIENLEKVVREALNVRQDYIKHSTDDIDDVRKRLLQDAIDD